MEDERADPDRVQGRLVIDREAWTTTMSDDPVDYIDMVTCGHDDRSVVADLESCYSHDRYCLGCAIEVLRSFRDAPPLLFRDLIRSRFDKVCCHLWFGLADGSFRCECPCGHRDRSSAEGGGIAVDRLVCAGCLGKGHAVDTPVPSSPYLPRPHGDG